MKILSLLDPGIHFLSVKHPILLATEFQSIDAYKLGSELNIAYCGFKQLKTKCPTVIHHSGRSPSKADLFQPVLRFLCGLIK